MVSKKCDVITNEMGEEIVNHQSLLFHISAYLEDMTKGTVAWHWHPDFEIIWAKSGNLCVEASSNTIILEEGQGIFINSGVIHAVKQADTVNSLLSSIVYDTKVIGATDSVFFQKYIKPVIDLQQMPYIILNQNITWQNEVLCNAQEVWNQLEHKTNHYEFTVRDLLSKAMIEILDNNPSMQPITSTQIKREERCKTLLEYIRTHFAENISISSLGKVCHISETEVLRCFNTTLHTSPLQYLKQYRLQHALTLLNSSSLSILDIALSCGFGSSSYFTKVFQEEMHCTPSQYRKNQ